MDEVIEKMFAFMNARKAAEEAGEKEFKCPLCGGRAWWGRAKTNNHLHCGCEKCGYRIIQ